MLKKWIYSLILFPMFCSFSCDEWKMNLASEGIIDDDDVGDKKNIEYTITFKLDETILDTVTVKKGHQPIYDKEEPIKDTEVANGKTTTYLFAGWHSSKDAAINIAIKTENLPGATKDTTYYAIFEEKVLDGEFTYSDQNETIINGFSNKEITELIIPRSITSINAESFNSSKSYTNLKTVLFSTSLTSIGNSAFEGCTSLTSVSYYGKVNDNSPMTIGSYAFRGCSSLTTITLPDNVNKIERETFKDCTSLTLIHLPLALIEISNYLFQGCSKLQTVTLQGSLTSIGECAFDECSSLDSINIPNSVTIIKNGAFTNCSSLTRATLPNTISVINASLFSGCSSLLSITIPSSVTEGIGRSAFSGCSSLSSIEIPNNTEAIGPYAFSSCTNLTSVTIPPSVKLIASYSFDGDSSLTITYLGTIEQFNKIDVGSPINSGGKITVNCSDGSLSI